jgi:anthranilate synthase component 1
MFNKLSFDKFVALAENQGRVAVFREVSGDRITPIDVFIAFGDETKGGALLESSLIGRLGRYSFLHLYPFFEFKTEKGKTTVDEQGQKKVFETDPFDLLRAMQTSDGVGFSHDLSRYTGGLIGFIGYDCVRHFEDIPDSHASKDDMPEILFRRYKNTIAFDHQTGRVVISSLALVGADKKAAYDMAMARVDEISDKLLAKGEGKPVGVNTPFSPIPIDPSMQSPTVGDELSDDQFKDLVKRAKDYVLRGDVFQVVISRCFQKPCTVNPFEVYRALRLVSPSPYMFYIDAGDFVIAGASPEKQVSLEDGVMEICPLAGTRPRGNAPDSEVEADLLTDQKEKAEHMMLVDLARNDLGMVSEPGTVQVDELMKVHKFSHVMHLSSSISGKLKEDVDAFEVLSSSFPAGTLSGAPKIRAMKIIDSLEVSRRGLYGGSICAIDNLGNLNSCIAIRMTVIKNGVATIRAGAGIVADSDPFKETLETRHKARSVLAAIEMAEGGL